MQSVANQSQVSFSLIYGKIQGNSLKEGGFGYLEVENTIQTQILMTRFPKNWEQGNFAA